MEAVCFSSNMDYHRALLRANDQAAVGFTQPIVDTALATFQVCDFFDFIARWLHRAVSPANSH